MSNSSNFEGMVIHDNVMPAEVVENWLDFYEHSASFRYTMTEHTENHSNYNLAMVLNTKILFEVFSVSQWLLPLIADFCNECTMKNHMRSYINLCDKHSVFQGHTDCDPLSIKQEEFFVSTVVFLNPHVSASSKAGLLFDNDQYVENVFNRMVVFNGTMWHKICSPVDNMLRITLYNSFSKPSKKIDHRQSKSAWHR